MLKKLRDPRLVRDVVALWLGLELSALIWLAGLPELSWLGFSTAAVLVATGTVGRCSIRRRGARP